MDENKNETLAYYIKLIRKWKMFIVIHLIAVAIAAVVLSFIVPQTYTSEATILPSDGTGILNTIVPPQMTEGLGGAISRLTGSSANDTNRLISILNSRTMAESVIDEFNLIEKFEAPTIEDAIGEYREMVSVSINDEQMLNLTVRTKTRFFNLQDDIDETRKFSFDLANYILNELDERFTSLNVEKASFERRLLEERFEQNKQELAFVENQLLDFSKENSMIDLPSQVQASVEIAAELEAQILVNEIELLVLQQTFDQQTPEVRRKQTLINESRKRLNELKLTGSENDGYAVLPSFAQAPDLLLDFARLQREQQVQSIIYEFLIQQIEQIKLEEAKKTPTLQFIDIPALPTKRSAPVRSIFVIVLTIIGAILGAGYILIHELYTRKYKEMILTAWNDEAD